MRDFCEIAKNKGPNYENLFSTNTKKLFSDCSINANPLQTLIAPSLSIPANI